MKQFNFFLLLFISVQTIVRAQINDQVIGDTKFWATGKIKPISMTNDERDPKVTLKLEEEYNGATWFITSADSSKLDNSCARIFSAIYNSGFNQPLKINLRDSFTYANGRLATNKRIVYNSSTVPPTVSGQISDTYFYKTGSRRAEPDSILRVTTQGAFSETAVKSAAFNASGLITSVVFSDQVGGVSIPVSRNLYNYSLAGLRSIVAQEWSVANARWEACSSCENFIFTYDNSSRLIEQVQNGPNGDSLKHIMTYIGTTNKVKTITIQVKATGTTTWVTESQTTNTAQNAAGYPTNIDYFGGGDSLRVGFQYMGDTAMTRRLLSIKGLAGFVNESRLTQTFSSAVAPTISVQPVATLNATVGGATQSFGVSGSNITTFQWQVNETGSVVWHNITPADSAIYLLSSSGTPQNGSSFVTILAASIAQNGYRFRCILYNGCSAGTVSTAGTLSVQACTAATPIVTFQPADVPTFEGRLVRFSVTASNVANYEWYYYLPNDTTTRIFVSPTDTAFTGQSTSTLTLKFAKVAYNGYYFRCNLINGCASGVTNLAKLTVQICTSTVPTIQAQPVNRSVFLNEAATFTIASNTPAVSYRWQIKTPTATAWMSIFISDTTFTGQQTNTLTVKYAKYAYNGYKYRCNALTCAGSTASDSAVLTVNYPVAVRELTDKVTVYPNPVDNVINIDLPMANFKVTFYDSKGSVVLVSENKTQIPVKDLPAGLYFLRIKTDEGEITKKIFKN
jgi:hypothetical protein